MSNDPSSQQNILIWIQIVGQRSGLLFSQQVKQHVSPKLHLLFHQLHFDFGSLGPPPSPPKKGRKRTNNHTKDPFHQKTQQPRWPSASITAARRVFGGEARLVEETLGHLRKSFASLNPVEGEKPRGARGALCWGWVFTPGTENRVCRNTSNRECCTPLKWGPIVPC